MIKAERAIQFDCEQCGETQYFEYTLEHGWCYDDGRSRAVMQDEVQCEFCGHMNHVYQEL